MAQLETRQNVLSRTSNRTGPIANLSVEVGVLPPELRCEQLTREYYVGSWAKHNHKLHKV